MKISLVILTLNEIEGLRVLLSKIPFSAVDEVLAIDGGSTDGTIQYLKENKIDVHVQDVKGRGEAFRLAFKIATGEALIFYSPDGNEDPYDISKFRHYLDQGSDIIIANRMSSGGQNEEDGKLFPLRKWANNIFTLMANVCWNKNKYIYDTINGFRSITRIAWQELNLDGPGYTIEYQMSIRAFKTNLKITEFPTIESKRIDDRIGSPSIPTGIAFLKIFFSELYR